MRIERPKLPELRIAGAIAPAAIVAVTLITIFMSWDQSGGDLSGVTSFYVSFVTAAAIYGIFTIGLNVQWGYTGVFNFGVMAFFLVGAYTAAIVSKGPAEGAFTDYVGGFGRDLDLVPALATDQWLPQLIGLLAAAAVAGLLALALSVPTLRLREDYLAIATIGVAELLRRITIQETPLVNGTRGLTGIPRPLDGLVSSGDYQYVIFAITVVVLVLIYLALERAIRSPWGRVLLGLREDEVATEASGKNVFAFKTQSFVLGAAIMGIGGAVYAYFASSLTPEVFTHFFATFLFWAMLILGGSGNNKGAIAGAYVLWGFWTITLQLQGYDLGNTIETRMPYIRELVLGGLIVGMLLLRPQGLLPQERRVSKWLERRVRHLRAAARRQENRPEPPSGPEPIDRA